MKNRFKQILSGFLAAAMLSGTGVQAAVWFPASAMQIAAVETGDTSVPSGLEYTVEDGGTVTIKKYTGESANLTIPQTIEGYTVTKIGKNAFADNLVVQNVVLPDTIVEIDYKGFASCKNLEIINFPDSLKTIGDYAFTTCHSLRSIDLNQVESIGECTFQLCISLEEITVPGTISYVPDHAFHGCSAVDKLIFEDGVAQIAVTAALNMYALTEIVISDSVVSIEEYALGYTYYHPDYTRMDVVIYGYAGSAAETYATENGFQFMALDSTTTTTTMTVPTETTTSTTESTTTTTETTTTTTSTTTTTTTTEQTEPVTTTNQNRPTTFAFSSNGDGTVVLVGCISDKDYIDLSSESVSTERIIEIADDAFSDCPNLETLLIPASVAAIDADAFSGCEMLAHIIGYSGTAAETFAVENGLEFLAIGDLDRNGAVNSADAVSVLKAYAASMLGETMLDSIETEIADADANGLVNSKDAILILQYYAADMLGNADWVTLI